MAGVVVPLSTVRRPCPPLGTCGRGWPTTLPVCRPVAPLAPRRWPLRRAGAEGPVVPLPYSQRVFASSWLVAITTGVAALHGQVMCSFLCSLVLFGTANYWRDPQSGWRRRADFFFANFGIGYHLVLALVIWAKTPLEHKIDLTSASLRPLFLTGPSVPSLSPLGFWTMWGAALFLYLRARSCAQKGDFDSGTKWHVVFHVVGNLANILLYPSLQPP